MTPASPERVRNITTRGDGRPNGRAHRRGVLDLRPVVWDATMVTPLEDRDVTVVVRVTYRTLEQICLDLGTVTESAAARTN